MSTPIEKDADSVDNPETQLTLGKAQRLLKAELIQELRQRGVDCKEDDKRDELRDKLVDIVRTEIETREIIKKSQEEEKVIPGGASNSETASTDSYESAGSSSARTVIDNVSNTDADSDNDNMAEKPKIHFKLNTDDWEAFTERLELQFKLKKTEEELKTAVLLTSVDEEAYILFRNLCAPVKPSAKNYTDLIDLMSSHINPKPSKVMERCIFHKAKQGEHESIAEFAARLRKLSLHCEFEKLEDALCDQFVCGVHDESTRIELFKITDLKFDKALKEALARENAVKNAAGAEKTLLKSTAKEEVFAIERGTKQNTRGKWNRQNSRPTQHEKRCYCCGSPEHLAGQCRYRGATCHGCGRKGHLQKACLSKEKKTSNQFLEEDGEADSTDNSTTENNYVDFYSISAKTDNANNCYNLIRADPTFLDIEINGKVVSMEIDTGTYFTVVSEKCIDKYFKDCKLEKACTNLVNYEQSPMKPLGQLRNLKVKLKKKIKI